MSDEPDLPSSDDVVTEFLRAYRQDREDGVDRTLRGYLDRWPGEELAVADAWVAREKSSGGGRGLDGPLTLRQNWVGPYRTIKLIGRGGQGEVFLAEDSRLRRMVALKVLTAIGPLSDELLVRFRREAELASKLEHPHLCRVYDTGIENDIPYIAMQFVEGEPLSETIARARERGAAAISLPSTGEEGGPPRRDMMRVVEFFEKVARAMQAAHDRGVIHRDIKPGNLMLTPEAEPVVLDFGVARDLDSPAHTLTQSGELFGSPAYMAPEQLGKKSKIDRRTDVYSLGLTLFECLTLHRPFEAPTLEGLCHAILTQSPPDATALNPQIPRDLRIVLETALEKDRDHRYRRALEFAEDLRRVREMRPIRAKPPGAVVRFERWVQRNPITTSFAAAMLVVVGVGLIGALVLLDRLRTEAAGKATALETAKTALASRERLIDEMSRLADVQRLRDLDRWDARLWPVLAANLEGEGSMAAWVHEARALRDRLPLHQASLAAMAPDPDGDATLMWRVETLREIVAAASTLPARIAAMQGRIELARRLAAPPTAAVREAWREASSAIAADARYGGLGLRPQAGLVPLGRDEASTLFEFAHAPSGRVPDRADDGHLVLADDSAIVLVLVPGHASADRDPVAPFFIAKHDLTEAQWRRAFPLAEETRAQAREAVRRFGLVLPSQTQWEAASLALGADFGERRDRIGVRPVRAIDPAEHVDGGETKR